MLNKLIQRIQLYKQLRVFEYLHLNYFCGQVIRTDNSRIFPYKGSVIDLAPNAKIYLGGGDIEIGCDKLRGSHAETRVRLRDHAIWSSEGGCKISYESTVEVLNDAHLETQFFTLNSNSVVIAAKKIQFGQDVMVGRGVVIYDSDHHSIWNVQGALTNQDAPIYIGDHVWLATNSTVLKGSSIGFGSVVAANATVDGNVPPGRLYYGSTEMREHYGTWNREHPKSE